MSGIDKAGSPPGQHSSYFYLSYAHSPPLAGTKQADPDKWVSKFYHDLTDSVQRCAPPRVLTPGFFDQDIPLRANWNAALTNALSTAEVFVPLLSPGYYARSWPGREWACFLDRLNRADIPEPDQRFAPVLWIPLPGGQDLPGLSSARALGASEEAYADNGLRALLRLAPYQESYHRVVDRLAGLIVDLAVNSPMGPSAATDIGQVASAFHPATSAAVFTIAVAAPTLGDLPSERDSGGYGHRGTDWRAYPADQELPLTEYAAHVAEQLDFAVVVTDLDKTGELPGNMPGVILVDPWFAADSQRLSTLKSFIVDLPPWVMPLLVFDALTDAGAAKLAESVRAILGEAAAGRTEPGRLARRGVSSLREFVSLMPILVAEAERQYLRHGPVVRSTAPPGSRPRLAGDGWPANRAS